MASAITYDGDLRRSDVESSSNTGSSLFAGQKLFFSRTVPQRQRFIDQAESNGATITALDTEADVVLFDHARKNSPPGAYSYRYVELSIRKGRLEALQDHLIASASRVERSVGSITTAPKAGRNFFTSEEDQLLWNWIKPYIEAGGAWKGNDIYKQLERCNPRHTFQSWRDRWIKHTQFQKRQITAPVGPYAKEIDINDDHANADPEALPMHSSAIAANTAKAVVIPTSTSASSASISAAQSSQPHRTSGPQSFPLYAEVVAASLNLPLIDGLTEIKARALFRNVPSIASDDATYADTIFTGMAKIHGGPDKEEIRQYFYRFIVPEYRARLNLTDDKMFEEHLENYSPTESVSTVESREHGKNGGDEAALLSATASGVAENAPVSPDIITRFPGAKESRKYSQGRDSQPNTHSQELSTQTQSMADQDLPDIPYRDESLYAPDTNHAERHELDTASAASPGNEGGFVHQGASLKRRHAHSMTAESETETKKRRKDREVQRPGTAVSKSQESEAEGRFVTQLTGNLNSQSEDDKASTSIEGIATPFVPAARQPAMTGPSDVLEEDRSDRSSHLGQASSPPMVQLVDGGDAPSTRVIPTTPSTASDAMSEHIAFDNSLDLSHAWETAPQGDAAEAESDSARPYHVATFRRGAKTRVGQMLSDADEDEPEGTEGVSTQNSAKQSSDYETAPQTLPRLHASKSVIVTAQGHVKHTARHRAGNTKMDTQDLIRQPLPTHVENASFTIPPPAGGWADEEDPNEHGTISDNEIDESVQQTDDAGNDVTNPTPAVEAEEVDVWLDAQKLRYSSIEPAVLDEVCMKALEATSMEVKLATVVVKTIARKIEKGKDPSLRRLHDDTRDRRRSTSRQRKARRQEIAQIVDDLMPTDQRGVWTKADDADLTGIHARLVAKLAEKHGDEGVNLRFEYLDQLYNDA